MGWGGYYILVGGQNGRQRFFLFFFFFVCAVGHTGNERQRREHRHANRTLVVMAGDGRGYSLMVVVPQPTSQCHA